MSQTGNPRRTSRRKADQRGRSNRSSGARRAPISTGGTKLRAIANSAPLTPSVKAAAGTTVSHSATCPIWA